VVAGASDTHGIWRGKRLPVADFLARLGPVQHYVIMKRFEAEKFSQQVSDWEIRRYVEMA
jgi:hypothetical protein